MFFGLSPFKLMVIAGIILLLFGNRLPGTMRSLGRSIVEFKKGLGELEGETSDQSTGKKPAAQKSE